MAYDSDRLSSGDVDFDELDIPSGFPEGAFGAVAEGFYGVYRLFFAGREWTEQFENQLSKAAYSRGADTWLSGAMAVGASVGGALTFVALSLAVIGVLPFAQPSVNLNFLPEPEVFTTFINVLGLLLGWLVYAGLGALIGVVGGSGLAIIWPYIVASRRRREIGIVLPDAVGFMHSLSATGMSHMEIFRKVAESEDTYGEFAVEFQRIVNQVDLLNEDFDTAVKNVSETTPNEKLERFLSTLLSQIGAGGDVTYYLEEAKDREQRNKKRDLNSVTDLLEFLGYTYMVLLVFPMLLIIILTVMTIFGSSDPLWIALTVYIIAPLVNVIYAVAISAVKIDEVGDGLIRTPDGTAPGGSIQPFQFKVLSEYLGKHKIFRGALLREIKAKMVDYAYNRPLELLTYYPWVTFLITVPATLIGWSLLLGAGILKPSVDAIIAAPIQQTVAIVYWPMFSIALPYIFFYEIRANQQSGLLASIEEDFRSLANINSQGHPLPESLRIISEDGSSRISEEFGIMYKKMCVGTPLTTALAEMNNKYAIPRLARQMKILEKAQDVSTEISDVLNTAADTAQYQQQIRKDQMAKMQTQLVIVEVGFIVFLLILAGIETGFIDIAVAVVGESDTSGTSGSAFGSLGGVDPNLLRMYLFHGALSQGIAAGVLAGYIKLNDPIRGVKYAIFNAVLTLIVFALAPVVFSFL